MSINELTIEALPRDSSNSYCAIKLATKKLDMLRVLQKTLPL